MVTLDGSLLSGPRESLDLTQVTGARLVDNRIRRSLMRRLELTHPKGTFTIAINIARNTPADDPDLASHRALIRAVATQLAAQDPHMPVAIGEGPRARLAMFIVGVLALLIGLGIGIAASITGISGDRMAAAAAPMLALIALGVITVQSNRPWGDDPQIPAATLPLMIDALDGRLTPPA